MSRQRMWQKLWNLAPKRTAAWLVVLGLFAMVFLTAEYFIAPRYPPCIARVTGERSDLIWAHALCTVSLVDRHSGFFSLLSAIAVAAFTFTLWRSTEKLWRAGKEALEATDRAFVFIDGFNVELTVLSDLVHSRSRTLGPAPFLPNGQRAENPDLFVTRFAVQPRWKNGGNTPTKGMTIRVDWREPGLPLAGDFTYDYADSDTRFFLAPKATEPSAVIEMHGANTVINDGMPHRDGEPEPSMFIWGRADYSDAFGQRRFTQWCYQVRFERHSLGPLKPQFIQWGPYNRTETDSGP